MSELIKNIIIALSFSVLFLDSPRIENRKVVPIVFELDYLPNYTRKRPLIKRLNVRDIN